MPPSSEVPRRTDLPEAAEYTQAERKLLLAMAHESILSSLENRTETAWEKSAHLSQPRGAFTTLYHQGKLRGCVGYPLPVSPLERTVRETARAAAFDDPRFAPVTLDQARELQVSLSVLSPLKPIPPEDVEVGRHGLLISQGFRRGLLLPQVPTEHGWDRDTFLEQTCRKAGLPTDAWRKGATVEAFTAEVFGDGETQAISA
jgi:AmmeMemoRadiSam system protein A